MFNGGSKISATENKDLSTLWKHSTDLNNPDRHRAMFDLAFQLWNASEHDDAVAVAGGLIDALAEERGSQLWVEANRLKSLALHDSLRDEEAIEAIKEALCFADVIANSLDYAFMQWHLADCYRTTNQPVLQEAAYKEAIIGFTDAGHEYFQGQTHLDLGALLVNAMRYTEARDSLMRAVPLLESHGRTDRIILAKFKLAFVERKLGALHIAQAHAQDAMSIAKFSQDVNGERECKIELGTIHSALGNHEMASDLLNEVINDNDHDSKRETAAKALYALGLHQLKAGAGDASRLAEARATLQAAIPLLKAVGMRSLAQHAELTLLHH